MRFYTKQHQFYCGIDLHARTMYLCILNQAGEILVHRHRVHYVILTSSPLEDPTVVGWPKKVIFQPTSGGVPDGPGSRSLL